MDPEVRYAKHDDVHIAYAVEGSGPIDVVIVGHWMWSIAEAHRSARAAAFNDAIGRFARVISYDQRGTGQSDPVAMETMASLDQWLDDLIVVLDAADCERAVLYGFDAAGPLAALCAATYPERVTALILAGTFARVTRAKDYPCGIEAARAEHLVEWVEASWTSHDPRRFVNALQVLQEPDDFVRSVRRAASPGVAVAITKMLLAADVRDVLPAIHVPTLVIHGNEDRYIDVCHGRYLAAHIPDATYCERPSGHSLEERDDWSAMIEIERFLTGNISPTQHSRVLATILFTDIVRSTERNAELGDSEWRNLLTRHDRSAEHAVEKYQGKTVKQTGDGILAMFDGPGRAVRCAARLVKDAAALGVPIRAGLHVGEVEVRGDDVNGMTVNIAARICSLAEPGTVAVSRTIPDLVVGSGLEFETLGEHELKGVPGTWQILGLSDAAV